MATKSRRPSLVLEQTSELISDLQAADLSSSALVKELEALLADSRSAVPNKGPHFTSVPVTFEEDDDAEDTRLFRPREQKVQAPPSPRIRNMRQQDFLLRRRSVDTTLPPAQSLRRSSVINLSFGGGGGDDEGGSCSGGSPSPFTATPDGSDASCGFTFASPSAHYALRGKSFAEGRRFSLSSDAPRRSSTEFPRPFGAMVGSPGPSSGASSAVQTRELSSLTTDGYPCEFSSQAVGSSCSRLRALSSNQPPAGSPSRRSAIMQALLLTSAATVSSGGDLEGPLCRMDVDLPAAADYSPAAARRAMSRHAQSFSVKRSGGSASGEALQPSPRPALQSTLSMRARSMHRSSSVAVYGAADAEACAVEAVDAAALPARGTSGCVRVLAAAQCGKSADHAFVVAVGGGDARSGAVSPLVGAAGGMGRQQAAVTVAWAASDSSSREREAFTLPRLNK